MLSSVASRRRASGERAAALGAEDRWLAIGLEERQFRSFTVPRAGLTRD
jgi:hypothetical protein